MNFTNVKTKAMDFFSEAGFISHITNEEDYENALALMDDIIEDYDTYLPLIDLVSISIENWENESPEFDEFNKNIERLDDGVAALRTLMDQYNLKPDDLKENLGSKSLVSMILNGSRNLTREHIQSLSDRFKIDPSVFFHKA